MQYYFDESKATRVVEFVETQLRHVEGKLGGQPFVLESWQRQLLREVFGWRDKEGLRRYRFVYLCLGARNGKTTLVAAILAWFLFCEQEPGQQLYSAASTKEQAALLFRILAAMIRSNAALNKRCKIVETTKFIRNNKTGATFKSLCSTPDNLQGLNANCIAIDEIQTIRNRDLIDTLVQRTGSRTQPLVLYFGTSGWDRRSIAYELHQHALQVRETPELDPSFYPCVFSAPDEADPHEETTWRLANPNLGQAIQLDYLRQESERAKRSPAYLNSFRMRHLAQWVEAESRFLSLESWSACKATLPDLTGQEAVLAFDLSTSRDLTAVVVAIKRDGLIYFVDRSFIPEDRMHERQTRDRVPYQSWRSWVTVTPGNVVDYSAVKAHILECCETYNVVQVGYDPWNATQIAIELTAEGLNLTPLRQGFATMSEPTKTFERLVLAKEIRHDSPVLDWQAQNLCVKSDDNGNIRPVKPANDEPARIDTLLCCIMATKLLSLESEYQTAGAILV